MIELWETFLYQMDAEDDEANTRAEAPPEPLAASAQPPAEQRSSSHPADGDDSNRPPSDGVLASTTDVALEQDA